jgi:catechol 2,3-dioxygenase-like lactoylglutathione lyase family enzyme
MVGLMVEDMPRALAFYRRLGLDIPREEDAKQFVILRMDSGVTLFWDTVFAETYDPSREKPAGGLAITAAAPRSRPTARTRRWSTTRMTT